MIILQPNEQNVLSGFALTLQPLFGSSIPFRRKWWLSMSKSVRYLWQATLSAFPWHWLDSTKFPGSFPSYVQYRAVVPGQTEWGGSFQRKIQYLSRRQQPQHVPRVDITGRPFEPLILWALDWCSVLVMPWLTWNFAYRIFNVLNWSTEFSMYWICKLWICTVDLRSCVLR